MVSIKMQPGVRAAAPVGVVDAGSSVEEEKGVQEGLVSPVVRPRNRRGIMGF